MDQKQYTLPTDKDLFYTIVCMEVKTLEAFQRGHTNIAFRVSDNIIHEIQNYFSNYGYDTRVIPSKCEDPTLIIKFRS